MKVFKSTSRALRRGNLKFIELPQITQNEGLQYVPVLHRKTNAGTWIPYKG